MTAVLMMIGSFAIAQRATPGIDTRQHIQRARIHSGRASGELTNREAARLNMQQRHIRRAERRVKADGEVTAIERRRLNHAQNHANRAIRRQKNGGQGKQL